MEAVRQGVDSGGDKHFVSKSLISSYRGKIGLNSTATMKESLNCSLFIYSYFGLSVSVRVIVDNGPLVIEKFGVNNELVTS